MTTFTINAGHNEFAHVIRATVGSVGTGNVTIVPYWHWYTDVQSPRTVSGASGWITVPLDTTNATSLPLDYYFYLAGTDGTDHTAAYDYS